MSLLKRLEHGANGCHRASRPTAQRRAQVPPSPIEPTFRAVPIQSQATEAQRSLKERVQAQADLGAGPLSDTNEIDEVRHRLKPLSIRSFEAENLVRRGPKKSASSRSLRRRHRLRSDRALLHDPTVTEIMVNGPRRSTSSVKGACS